MPFKTRYGSHYHMTEGCHGATIPCGTEGLMPCSDCCVGERKGSGAGAAGGSGGLGNPGAAALGDAIVDSSRIEDGDIVRWKDEYSRPGDEERLMVAIEPLHKEDGGNGSVYVRDLGSEFPAPGTMLTRIEYLELAGANDLGNKSTPVSAISATDLSPQAVSSAHDLVPIHSRDYTPSRAERLALISRMPDDSIMKANLVAEDVWDDMVEDGTDVRDDKGLRRGFLQGMAKRGIQGDFARRIYAELLSTRDQELGFDGGGYVVDYLTDEELAARGAESRQPPEPLTGTASAVVAAAMGVRGEAERMASVEPVGQDIIEAMDDNGADLADDTALRRAFVDEIEGQGIHAELAPYAYLQAQAKREARLGWDKEASGRGLTPIEQGRAEEVAREMWGDFLANGIYVDDTGELLEAFEEAAARRRMPDAMADAAFLALLEARAKLDRPMVAEMDWQV